MKKWIIYKYTSPSKRCYIGQTYTETRRKADHRKKEGDFTDTTPFARCIQRYGFENLEYEVIDRATSQEEADEKEKFWIKSYDAIKSGYNVTEGGNTCAAYTHDDRVIEDIMCMLKNSNFKQQEIADKMGVSVSTVSEIKNGNLRNSTPIERDSHQSQKGIVNPQSKLTEDQVTEIRERLQKGESRKSLQNAYNISKTLVQQIATNQAWKHVEADYEYKKKEVNGNAKLNREIVARIKADFRDGTITRVVAEKYGIAEATANQIRYGKTWKDVE